jgi:hypothetical protein
VTATVTSPRRLTPVALKVPSVRPVDADLGAGAGVAVFTAVSVGSAVAVAAGGAVADGVAGATATLRARRVVGEGATGGEAAVGVAVVATAVGLGAIRCVVARVGTSGADVGKVLVVGSAFSAVAIRWAAGSVMA